MPNRTVVDVAVRVGSRERIQTFLRAVEWCPHKGEPVRNFEHGCSVGSAKLRDVSDLIGVYAFSSVSHTWLDKRTSNNAIVFPMSPLLVPCAQSKCWLRLICRLQLILVLHR